MVDWTGRPTQPAGAENDGFLDCPERYGDSFGDCAIRTEPVVHDHLLTRRFAELYTLGNERRVGCVRLPSRSK